MPLPGSLETGTGSSNHLFIQLLVGTWALILPYITVWTRGWENPVPASQLSGKDTIIMVEMLPDSFGEILTKQGLKFLMIPL